MCVKTYLEEEVRQEGLTRNLGVFYRFLEAASFLQGSVLNLFAIAQECAAFETLFFQELSAVNDYFELGFNIYYWRTSNNQEVDFVLYEQEV